jgi:hypothetical protein
MLASTGSAAMAEREARWFAAAAMGEYKSSSITRDGQAQGELSEGCCAVHAELIPDRCCHLFFSSGAKALVPLCIVKRPGSQICTCSESSLKPITRIRCTLDPLSF